MQKLVIALALGAANAFVAPAAQSAAVSMQETKQDLMDLQNSLPGPPGFYDPLGLADQSFVIGMNVAGDRGVGEEATIGWLRHAEIKHGRVAMAAFLGYLAQCTPLVSGEHKYLPYRGYSHGEAGSPEGYVHYMSGGKPGYYPPIKGKGGPGGHFLFNLWDPFTLPGGPSGQSAEQKARGLKVELLNGRAAQFGILGLLAESKVPGSVPFLSQIEGFPKYAGDVMAPFSGDFTLGLAN
ncbi:chlorophyll A-B binding protein [Aureococcus anophagefferens]|nr:chlorophyll A-B binding protein [Aureococcus anophagefferens]